MSLLPRDRDRKEMDEKYFSWLLDNYPDLFRDYLILLPGHRCQWKENEFSGPCGLKLLPGGEIERIDLPEMHNSVV